MSLASTQRRVGKDPKTAVPESDYSGVPSSAKRLTVGSLSFTVGATALAGAVTMTGTLWALVLLCTLGILALLVAFWALLWPTVRPALQRGIIRYLGEKSFRGTTTENNWQAGATESLSGETPARQESIERLREGWAACRPAFSKARTLLTGIAESARRELTPAERAAATLALESIATPLDELCDQLSEALGFDRHPTQEDLESAKELLSRAVLKYCWAVRWVVHLGLIFEGHRFTGTGRYEELYGQHVTFLEELRRLSQRSDTRSQLLRTGVEEMNHVLPKPSLGRRHLAGRRFERPPLQRPH